MAGKFNWQAGDTINQLTQIGKITQQQVTCHDGTKLPVTVVGAGEPVVLLHAFGMDARQFLPFVLPLLLLPNRRFSFYLPHFRGFGLASQLASTQLDFIEQYADDVDALLTHVCQRHHVTSVPVAAISMGALVVWAYLNRYLNPSNPRFIKHELNAEHRIKRYLNIDQVPAVHHQPDWQGGVFGEEQTAIFATFQKVLDETMPYLDKGLDLPLTHLPYAVKSKVVQTERAFSKLAVHRATAQWLAKVRYQTPYKLGLYDDPTWQQKIRCLQAYVTLPYDYRAGIDSLRIPVTFLIGSQSKLYPPKWQRAIADLVPNSTVIELAKSGHAVPVDAPIQFTRVLKTFVS